MRTEQEMMDLILSVARADERIRAVLLVGSRANPAVPKDIYQDYDITYFAEDIAPFYNNPAWVEERFGNPLIMQMPEAMRYPAGDGNFNYMMIYPDGVRIDLSFEFTKYIDDGEPAVVLLDKDNDSGFLPPLPLPSDKHWHIEPLSPLFYYSCCNNFWWCLNNVAKGIARDELPYVMHMLNSWVRAELNDMINWYIGTRHGFNISTGKDGKYFKKYLPPELYAQYAATFSGSGYADIWVAVDVMCDLFHTLAVAVAAHFGFIYRQNEEAGIREYLRMVRGMFCDMKEQLDNPAVLKIMAYSEYESSLERVKQKAAEFRRHESWKLYGWVENGEIVGVCGFEVHKDYVEILNIAVAENIHHHGVGGKMITALWKKYEMAIESETDDDAVDFYHKRGFSAADTQKYGVRRWTCVLVAPKPLDQETDKERQARIYPIILSEYNPAWPEWYAEEKNNLERLIGTESIARISHFGSTAVPGLIAKPTVDLLLEIKEHTNVDDLISVLSSPEYICLNPPDMPTPPPHLMFLKGYMSDGFAEKVYHIHVRYPGDYDELCFRDYLVKHLEIATEYATLKRSLFKDYEHDRDGYTEAKIAFIRKVTEKARKEKNHGKGDS